MNVARDQKRKGGLIVIIGCLTRKLRDASELKRQQKRRGNLTNPPLITQQRARARRNITTTAYSRLVT
ncbi:Uncharacterized protein HZ326_31443 [Fusarium oxysporum f. sp. albedinis]|nr:Uncharacterized protein HZ326_31443 [Fusarium oxysporum f. sp. albedinis]